LSKEITLKSPYLGKKIYTVGELLDLTLVRSDNYAAEILSKNFHGTRDLFIEAMNSKALALGMLSAQFVDPTGLGADNSATAKDIAKMVFASGQYPDIRRSAQKTVEVTTQQGRRSRTVTINNTNKDILAEFDNIVVSKTGTTSRAGKCVAMLVEKAGRVYAIVILGQPNKIKRDYQARNLMHNYLEPKPV
jgi:D-alanyl-D-alanine endopeptidase (penicillin-binding protein 7)